jgi:hypothetical protein
MIQITNPSTTTDIRQTTSTNLTTTITSLKASTKTTTGKAKIAAVAVLMAQTSPWTLRRCTSARRGLAGMAGEMTHTIGRTSRKAPQSKMRGREISVTAVVVTRTNAATTV